MSQTIWDHDGRISPSGRFFVFIRSSDAVTLRPINANGNRYRTPASGNLTFRT